MSMKGNLSGERVEAGSADIPEGGQAPVRITKQRALHVNLRDNDGNAVSDASTVPVPWDDYAVTYTDGNPTSVVFYKASVPVWTWTATYNSDGDLLTFAKA